MPPPAQARLKTLASITAFGLFRDFAWDATKLDDFGRYNLIYGWNYSGKTTLSRVFQSVEDRRIHLDFPGATFQFTKSDGSTVSSALTGDLPHILVFNREFVQRNFRMDTDMTGAKAIAVLGEANLALKDRLVQLKSREERVLDFRKQLQAGKDDEQEAIDVGATNQARVVNQIVGGPFTRLHLNQSIEELPSDHTPLPFSDTKLGDEKDQFRLAGDLPEVPRYSLDHRSVVGGILRIRCALKEVATNTALQAFRDNRDLECWVEAGLKLHAASSPCGFCGATITGERWSELRGHFSEAFSALETNLQGCEAMIDGVNLGPPTVSEVAMLPELRGRFRIAFKKLETCLQGASQVLASVGEIVRAKLGNLESSRIWRPDLSTATALRTAINEFNVVLKQHNDKVAAAEDVRAQSREAICQHFAVEYLRDCKVNERKELIECHDKRISNCAATTLRIEGQITAVQKEIENASVAARRVNENLAILLPGDNIEVVKLNEIDFQFQRNGQVAKNMSEGERTAVAFSYFLAKLEEGTTPLEESIVVLDDPVSSLDSNHIYAIHSITEKRLAKANQLFVLTHNSTFFGITKDWMKKVNGRFYMTQRMIDVNLEWYAELVPLPRLLKSFKSDYQYTYYCLKLLHDDPAPRLENLCGVPNMVRRLLEAYLGFVFPERGSWGDKLPRIITSEETCGKIQKFVDENSHSHSLSQATEVPDYVAHCKEVVGDVLMALRAHNPAHIASMEVETAAEMENLP